MNLDRRWLGTSLGRVRVLSAGLVLVAAGCMVLGLGSRSRHTAANAAAPLSGFLNQDASFLSSLAAAPSPSAGDRAGAQAHALSLFAGLPLMFEPNQGQANLDPADSRVKFVARGSGYSLYLGSEGAILNLRSQSPKRHHDATRVESLQMKLAGANPNPVVTATDRLPGVSNYILGNDPSKWRQGIPQFARVRYENIYPGINLVFYGNQGQLEYDFQVAPGSDPKQAELEFNGAKRLQLHDGALVISSEGGDVRLDAPHVYQQIAGRRELVEASFVLRGANRAGFSIGNYDHSRELVIDPQLSFATYFGGSLDEHNVSVAVDGGFNIYMTGSTTSATLPTLAGTVFQSTLNGTQNVFVAKIVPTEGSIASSLTYVTYLGGSAVDYPVGIAVDGAGNPYIAGTTTSPNFPTVATTAYQSAPEASTAPACPQIPSGICHVFVTELNNNPSGIATQLVYSSYLSGNGNDVASGMTIDASGDIFVTGTTTSIETSLSDQFPATNLPNSPPYQNVSRATAGLPQFFVTKVNTNAQRTASIAYSTYFGGGNFESSAPVATGGKIAVDTNGNLYFTGTTNYTYTGCVGCQLTDFPILNAYQPCLDTQPPTPPQNPQTCPTPTSSTANSDAFVAKMNPNAVQGQQLLWSSYFGGAQTDTGTGIALDTGAANVYLTGTTNSSDITQLVTFAAFQTCLDEYPNPSSGTACTNAIATTAYPNDAYVARFTNPTSTTVGTTDLALNYFSYLGGSGDEAGLAIVVDTAAGALVTGSTKSANFPVLPANNDIQSHLLGTQNAFMARINTVAQQGQTTGASWSNYYGGSGTDEGTSVALDVNQNSYFAGDSNSPNLRLNGPLPPAEGGSYNGGYDAFVAQVGSSCNIGITGFPQLGPNQSFISAGTLATFVYTITNGGPDLCTGLVVQDNISSSITNVALTFNSASTTSGGTCSGTISSANNVACTIPSLQSGSTATVTFVLTPTANSSGLPEAFNGGSVQVLGVNNIVLAHTTVSAQMSDFSISVNPSSFSVAAAGDTAPYTVLLTPHPIYGNISLSCSQVPPASSCNFTTTPVTLQSQSPVSPTLNIITTARPIVTPASLMLSPRMFMVWLSVPGLAIVGAGFGGRRKRRIIGVLMLCVLFGLLLLQPACTHGTTPIPTSGTPAGRYTIIVTATGGANDTKSQPVVLFVP